MLMNDNVEYLWAHEIQISFSRATGTAKNQRGHII